MYQTLGRIQEPESAHTSQTAAICIPQHDNERVSQVLKIGNKLEDIRALKYQGLKNLVVLATDADRLVAAFLGQQMKLRILTGKLLILQGVFGIAPFRFVTLWKTEFAAFCPAALSRRAVPARTQLEPALIRSVRKSSGKSWVKKAC